jgi:hypothetical protein
MNKPSLKQLAAGGLAALTGALVIAFGGVATPAPAQALSNGQCTPNSRGQCLDNMGVDRSVFPFPGTVHTGTSYGEGRPCGVYADSYDLANSYPSGMC